ncbi:MAG: hypothetical protein AAB214_17545, partial [Fibrobacterota bacterium]
MRFLPSAIATVLVALISVFMLRYEQGRSLDARVAFVQLQHAKAARDSASVREARVRDSVQQALSERDAAWGIYVHDL